MSEAKICQPADDCLHKTLLCRLDEDLLHDVAGCVWVCAVTNLTQEATQSIHQLALMQYARLRDICRSS